MKGPLFALATAWLFLVGSQVQETQAIRLSSHSVSSEDPPACQGQGATFIDISLGAHGGESLDFWFGDNQVKNIFYKTDEGELVPDMIRQDLLAGKDDLPQLQFMIGKKRAQNRCGHIFLGDIKPSAIVGGAEDFFAIGSHNMTYERLFSSLEKAFPTATFIWLIRHPDKWAQSLTHWKHPQTQEAADQFLQEARQSHANFHCAANEYFGNKVIGKPGFFSAQGNGNGGVVQMNLEQVGGQQNWQEFVQHLRDASGNQALSSEGGLPHANHHEPTWHYNIVGAPNTNNWDPWDFLKNNCLPKEFLFEKMGVENGLKALQNPNLFKTRPWDYEKDSGM